MIDNVADTLVIIAKQVSGIVSGQDPPPPVIRPGDLPCVYVTTGPARDGEETPEVFDAEDVLERRTFRVRVAVKESGQDNPFERETACRPLLDALKARLKGSPQLQGLAAFVIKATVFGDSGVTILSDYDGAFLGFEIEVLVWTYSKVTYYE